MISDPQFPHLGLFLLGNLARLRRVLIGLGWDAEQVTVQEVPESLVRVETVPSSQEHDLGEQVQRPCESDGIGLANAQLVTDLTTQAIPGRTSKPVKKRKKAGDVFDTMFDSLL